MYLESSDLHGRAVAHTFGVMVSKPCSFLSRCSVKVVEENTWFLRHNNFHLDATGPPENPTFSQSYLQAAIMLVLFFSRLLLMAHAVIILLAMAGELEENPRRSGLKL